MTQSDTELKQVDVMLLLFQSPTAGRPGVVTAESPVITIPKGQRSCSYSKMKLQPSHSYSKKQGQKEGEEEGAKHSRSYYTAIPLYFIACNLIAWPHLNVKDDGKCSFYSMQPCTLVKIKDSIK